MTIEISKSVSIIEISIIDFQDLYGLMSRIYPEAYQYLWNDDCSWYLNHVYGRESVKKELSEEDSSFYFVVVEGKKEGILKVQINKPFPEQPEVRSTRLQRIYLSEEVQGKGISHLLMQYVLSMARENKSEILWLDCMDSKKQALNYYFKNGFQKGTLSHLNFALLKDEYRGIYLMWRRVIAI